MIYIKNLNFSYKRNKLFKNFSLKIFKGQVIQLFGKNGSGKTTLLKIISGFIKPDSGFISKFKKENLIYIGHEISLIKNLSVLENIKINLEISGFSIRKKKINYILKKLNLFNLRKKYIIELSFGEKKIVSLIQLILKPSKIWILDEPFSSLDKKRKKWLSSLILQHKKNKGITILSNHQNWKPNFDLIYIKL